METFRNWSLQSGGSRSERNEATWPYPPRFPCVPMPTVPLAKRSRAESARVKHVRRSVTLPPKIAKQVETLAMERDLSDNRVLVELIEQGIEARQQKKKHSSS